MTMNNKEHKQHLTKSSEETNAISRHPSYTTSWLQSKSTLSKVNLDDEIWEMVVDEIGEMLDDEVREMVVDEIWIC